MGQERAVAQKHITFNNTNVKLMSTLRIRGAYLIDGLIICIAQNQIMLHDGIKKPFYMLKEDKL